MPTQDYVVPPSQAGIFLVLTVHDGAEEAIRDFLDALPGITRGVSFRSPVSSLNCVVGLGALLWDRLYDAPRPQHLHEFAELNGAKHAPSTPGDLLIHLRCADAGMCFELARQITDQLAESATVVDEVHGFKYFDQRDLLGFVDGTENPEGNDALKAVLVGDDDPAYRGSTYIIVQKYLHDLTAWKKLTVEEQQNAIGRTKAEDIELPDDEKPSNSHVALNTIEDADGNQRQILRDNMPFGRVSEQEFGTYFIGYAADPGITEEMLRNMFLGKPEGNYDRILDFSTAKTGCLFFAPTGDFLGDQPPAKARP